MYKWCKSPILSRYYESSKRLMHLIGYLIMCGCKLINDAGYVIKSVRNNLFYMVEKLSEKSLDEVYNNKSFI